MSAPNHRTPARPRRRARALVLAVVGATAIPLAAPPRPAAAATASTLQYSVDGGTTWTGTVTVAPGQAVLVRQWFENTGADTLDDAALTTSLPPGFTPAPGSTSLCLNPSTADPAEPDPAELACSPIDEAVWSGSDLAVSPTAGHFGYGSADTSGPLAVGRARYWNLHQCVGWSTDPRYDHSRSSYLPTTTYSAGSNVGPTADSSPVCDTSIFAFQSDMSGVTPFPLFNRRYLHLEQCRWVNDGTGPDARAMTSLIADTADSRWGTTSATTNVPAASSGCSASPDAGWTATPDTSGRQTFDLLHDRYLNLHECWLGYPLGEPSLTLVVASVGDSGWATGTNSSDVPATLGDASCTLRWDSGFTIGDGAAHAFDLLDPSRSAGYVTYEMTAPTGGACVGDGIERFTQSATLTAAATATTTATGAVHLDRTLPSGEPCPGTTTTTSATTTSPATTAPSPATTAPSPPTTAPADQTPAPGTGADARRSGQLARTGLATGRLALVGGGLVALGAGALQARRARRAEAG